VGGSRLQLDDRLAGLEECIEVVLAQILAAEDRILHMHMDILAQSVALPRVRGAGAAQSPQRQVELGPQS